MTPASEGARSADDDEVMTVDEVAAYLKVSKNTVYDWRRARRGPPAHPCGKHLRYFRSEVREWVRAQGDQER